MGRRELKAERTRQTILEAAFTAFEAQGFDATTMDQIAEAADIGIATLYRYFPTKDLLLLQPVVDGVGGLARALSERPADEPLDQALGNALHTYLDEAEARSDFTFRLRDLLDHAAGPRARLWDLLAQERTLLEQAIATRCHTDPTDLQVGIAAHTTMMITEMALDLVRNRRGERTATAWADQLMILLSDNRITPRVVRTQLPHKATHF
jgi:AcrR family transcriptional regulator